MGTTRFREKLTPVDPRVNGGGPWYTQIPLGVFRDKLFGYENGVQVELGWGQPHSPQAYTPEFSTCLYEKTWDELHHRNRRSTVAFTQKGQLPSYSEGGPFLNIKVDTGLPVLGVIGAGTYYSVDGTQRYEGGFMPPTSAYWGSGWAQTPGLFTNDANNALLPDVAPYFDRAWSKTKPHLEGAGGYVFLKEFGDAVPLLQSTSELFGRRFAAEYKYFTGNVGSRRITVSKSSLTDKFRMAPKFAADKFLSEEFGWLPFISDIQNFISTYEEFSSIVQRLTAENGQWRRRTANVVKDEDSSVIDEVTLPYNSVSYALPCFPVAFPSNFFVAPPSWKVVEFTNFTIHASGMFRFYRPEFDEALPDYSSTWNKVKRAIKLYGLEVSPYHIWQAIPWTWLADWVSNLGSFIQRFNDTIEDQIAAKYFYITSRKTVVRSFEINLPFRSGTKTLTFQRSFASKQRTSADNPYGFRLSWDDLTPKRLAILGSLGITKNNFGSPRP